MIESYIEKIHPLPVSWVYEYFKEDAIMDGRAESKQLVEIYIKTAGYNGSKRGNPKDLDLTFARLAASSYYQYLRPLPVSFQVLEAVEVHFRTPGVSDFDKKNPLRDIAKIRELDKEFNKKP
jgi:hypothetical protein